MFGTDVDFIETLKFVKSRRSISSTVSIGGGDERLDRVRRTRGRAGAWAASRS